VPQTWGSEGNRCNVVILLCVSRRATWGVRLMLFPCAYCPAQLCCGNRANLDHAIQHFGLDAVAVRLHRELERQGMSELDAHLTVQSYLSARMVHRASAGS